MKEKCRHKHLYVWAEEGAEYGRCYDCGEVILQRITDPERKGLYPKPDFLGRQRHHRYSAGIGNPDPGLEGAIKRMEE